MSIYYLSWRSRVPLNARTPINQHEVGQWRDDAALRCRIVMLKAESEESARAQVLQYFPDAEFEFAVIPTEKQIIAYTNNAQEIALNRRAIQRGINYKLPRSEGGKA